MAFKLNLSPSYFWPVTAAIPVNGKRQPIAFDAEFRRLTQPEIRAALDVDPATASDRDLAEQILVGWKGVQDEQGAEIAYSETMRATVLDIPGMATQICKAWLDSLKQADEKN